MVDKSCKSLLRAQHMIIYFSVVYLLLVLTLIQGLFTQGFTDIWALLNFVSNNILYAMTEYLLVAMLVNINLEFRLQT